MNYSCFCVQRVSLPDSFKQHTGLTVAKSNGWKEAGNGRVVAKTKEVLYVSIRLRFHNSTRCYGLQQLLATLLHEFAHVITPDEQQFGKDERGRRARKWHDIDHGDAFYANFAALCEAAERLGIFSLPGDPRVKYSKKALMKYDDVDSQAADMNDDLSTTDYKEVPLFMKEGDNWLEQQDNNKEETLRITLAKGSVKKMVMLKRTPGQTNLLQELEKLVKQKFRCKAKKMTNAKGEVVTADMMLILEQDSIITVI